MSSLEEELVSKAIEQNITKFYDNTVDSKTIFSSVSVLKGYFKAKTELEK